MEINDGGSSLSISEFPKDQKTERKKIANGVYEAVYNGMSVKLESTVKYGEKKVIRLFFKITKGPFKDETTSWKGYMFRTKDNQHIVPGESKLAEAIRKITNGKTELNDTYKGHPFLVTVKVDEYKDKKTGEDRRFDYISEFMARPVEDVAPEEKDPAPAAQAPTAAQPPKAALQAPKAPAPAKAAVTAADNGLMDDLSQLGDFSNI